MGEIRRAFHAQFVGQLPQEFRPLRLDARYADESSQYGQCGSRVLGRLYVEGRYDLAGRRLHLQPHLQHQSRRAASDSARQIYPCQGPSRGKSLATACQTVGAFRRFRFGRGELHALWDFGPVEPFGRLSSGAWAAARGRCGPVDATAHLHRSLLHLPCAAQ